MDISSLNSRLEPNSTAASPNTNEPVTAKDPNLSRAAHNQDSADSATEREQLQVAVADLQEYAQSAQRNLEFKLDDDSQRMIVTVTEASSGKLIRQMPSAEALRLSENLEEIRSVLFSGKV
ncbi:flagellar protein FlaG [Denitrificimonas caeni]|uniref:flagellar protein FlaG n=1 Tax=Denitrificimonas caeni TaxID=521720 RepID=UPI00196388DE|nr:flagellar protein FlaG [Denitrificimonas caeni]